MAINKDTQEYSRMTRFLRTAGKDLIFVVAVSASALVVLAVAATVVAAVAAAVLASIVDPAKIAADPTAAALLIPGRIMIGLGISCWIYSVYRRSRT